MLQQNRIKPIRIKDHNMTFLKLLTSLLLLLYGLRLPAKNNSSSTSHNLIAHVGLLPFLIESESKGSFIELLKAIDEVYTEGEIHIVALPMKRAIRGVIYGKADLSFPAMRHHQFDTKKLPYRFSSTPFGKVAHVMYMNKNRIFNIKKLQAAKNGEAMKLIIQGVPDFWPFPVKETRSIESALRQVNAGRIDGLLWAQEETDIVLKRVGLKNIYRVHFGDYDDVFILPLGERGNIVDAILTKAIVKLRLNNRLKTIYQKVHQPYLKWQP
jgi:polar amino acid transport system substrate-binding protein